MSSVPRFSINLLSQFHIHIYIYMSTCLQVLLYLFPHQRNIEAQNNDLSFGTAFQLLELSQNWSGNGFWSRKKKLNVDCFWWLFFFSIFFFSLRTNTVFALEYQINSINFPCLTNSNRRFYCLPFLLPLRFRHLVYAVERKYVEVLYHFGIWIAAKVRDTTLAMDMVDIAAAIQSHASKTKYRPMKKYVSVENVCK